MLQMRMQREQEEALREQECGTQADIVGDMKRIKEQVIYTYLKYTFNKN